MRLRREPRRTALSPETSVLGVSNAQIAQSLWILGFRPIAAEDVRKGMTTVINRLGHKPGRPPMMLTVTGVTHGDDGVIRVQHGAGVTESEPLGEVWVK